MVDHVGDGDDADVGDLLEPHVPTAGRVDEQVLQIGHASQLLGRGPQLHVVGLAGLEEVAGLLARHQPGGRPPDVARLEAVPPGRLEVDLHPDLGDVVLEVHVVLADAGDLLQDGVDLLRLLPEHVQVLAEDADRDGIAGAGQDLRIRSFR